MLPASGKSLKFSTYTVFELTGNEALGLPRNEEAVRRGIRFVFDGLASGRLNPVIDARIFTLNEIVEAHRYIESNQQNGKIVVTV